MTAQPKQITAILYSLAGPPVGRFVFDNDGPLPPELIRLETGQVFRRSALRSGGKVWAYRMIDTPVKEKPLLVTKKVPWSFDRP